MPDWLVEHLIGAFGMFQQEVLQQTTDTVRASTGGELRNFAEFARDHAHLFGS